MMGKAAKNERIKLRATFYNNLAVGAAITGLLVPYLAIYPKFFTAESWTTVPFTDIIAPEPALSIGVAVVVSLFCRSRADTWIATLED